MTQPMKMHLAPFLKRAGLSQTALAAAVGISRGYMSELTSGKKAPSIAVLNDIARVLGVDPGALIQDDDPRPGMAEAPQRYSYEPDVLSLPGPNTVEMAAVAPDAKHPSWWVAQRGAPGFGILPGDRIVVDLGAAPAPGDLVLATPADPESITLLRRWAGPWLFDDNGTEAPRSSSRGVAILGVVHAVLRSFDHLPPRMSSTS